MPSKSKPKADRKSTLRLEQDFPPAKKARVGSFTTPPPFAFGNISGAGTQSSNVSLSSQSSVDSQVLKPKKAASQKWRGKQKAISDEPDDRLWVDKFAPETEEDLAVHKRKVEDVRRWLGEAFSDQTIAKYRRLLVLTGPSGAGKTATLRVLSQELGFSVVEWISAHQTDANHFDLMDENNSDFGESSYESAFDKFEAFLTRAGSYRSVLSKDNSSVHQSSTSSKVKKAVILLEDLPNILHLGIRERFHRAIQLHIQNSGVPIIIIVSDTGTRGENGEFGVGSARWARYEEAVSIRTIVPKGLSAAHVTEISFNAIAPTLLTSALKRIRIRADAQTVPDSALASIVDSVAGDIRAGIMALEFTCIQVAPGGTRKRGRSDSVNIAVESLARKENALFLFHLLGKILYNKRKGDPPPTSATKRELAALRELDSRLKSEPPVHPWLEAEGRRTSRVNVDELYANTPIDASLVSLYIHQNYTPFCTELEHCDALIENMSWADANGGDSYYQQSPYAFHLYTLGTLHTLPTPVPRSGQKFYKPEFFDVIKRTRDASDAVDRIRSWLCHDSPSSASTWTPMTSVLELGPVLRARDLDIRKPPREHTLFSHLLFSPGGSSAEEAGERDAELVIEDEDEMRWARLTNEDARGTWLEDDDIEEW